MRKARKVFFIIIAVVVTLAVLLTLISLLKPKVAGIFIESNPAAAVLINGEQVGRTPFRNTREPGDVVVKLIPESFETPLTPYETKISLIPGVETVMKWDFGELEETSAGEIISFEKVSQDQTGLVVVSIPNSAHLVIDGYQKSITPHKVSSVSPGEHTLLLSAKGYFDRSVRVKTHAGYKLTAVVKLAVNLSEIEPPAQELELEEGNEEETAVDQVEILSTSVGFLRVRKEPSTLAEEVGRVEPGDIFNLLETDEKTGWYKIEHEEGEEGWISNQYAKKINGGSSKTTPTAFPSPTLTPKPTKTF